MAANRKHETDCPPRWEDDWHPGRNRPAETMMRLMLITIFVFSLSGCALMEMFWEDEDDETAQSLAWDGMDDYESGDYDGAKESF